MVKLGNVLKSVAFGAIVGASCYAWGTRNPSPEAVLRDAPHLLWGNSAITEEQKEALITEGVNSLSLDGRVAFFNEGFTSLDEVSQYQVLDSALDNLEQVNVYRTAEKALRILPAEVSQELAAEYAIETVKAASNDETITFGERIYGLWERIINRISGDNEEVTDQPVTYTANRN